MAVGDITIFDEALEKMLDGNWAPTDEFYLAVVKATVTPTAAFATPTWSDFSAEEVNAGVYVANGVSLGTLGTLATQAAGTMTFDSSVNPTWAANAGHSTNARWGIIYNFTDAAQDALAFVDLGTVDMTAVPLAITWSGTGIFTSTQV